MVARWISPDLRDRMAFSTILNTPDQQNDMPHSTNPEAPTSPILRTPSQPPVPIEVAGQGQYSSGHAFPATASTFRLVRLPPMRDTAMQPSGIESSSMEKNVLPSLTSQLQLTKGLLLSPSQSATRQLSDVRSSPAYPSPQTERAALPLPAHAYLQSTALSQPLGGHQPQLRNIASRSEFHHPLGHQTRLSNIQLASRDHQPLGSHGAASTTGFPSPRRRYFSPPGSPQQVRAQRPPHSNVPYTTKELHKIRYYKEDKKMQYAQITEILNRDSPQNRRLSPQAPSSRFYRNNWLPKVDARMNVVRGPDGKIMTVKAPVRARSSEEQRDWPFTMVETRPRWAVEYPWVHARDKRRARAILNGEDPVYFHSMKDRMRRAIEMWEDENEKLVKELMELRSGIKDSDDLDIDIRYDIRTPSPSEASSGPPSPYQDEDVAMHTQGQC